MTELTESSKWTKCNKAYYMKKKTYEFEKQKSYLIMTIEKPN